MDVFDLRLQIVVDYAIFARSFTRTEGDDLCTQVTAIYAKSPGLVHTVETLAAASLPWTLAS